jgi:hypothetical protein
MAERRPGHLRTNVQGRMAGTCPAMTVGEAVLRPPLILMRISVSRATLFRYYSGNLVKDGNVILPVATLAGHTVTGLPFCHCTISPVM